MDIFRFIAECGIILILCLEICNCEKSKVKSKKSSTTSYFRHEPYGPRTYAYGFEVNDNKTGNRQFRDERRYLNGSVEGSYGYLRPDGRVTVTNFIADPKRGYQSETRSFEQNSLENIRYWPTKMPKFLAHGEHDNGELINGNITYDETTKLNLTTGQLHENLTNALETEHGIEVNHIDLVDDLLSPTLLDIVNGKVPLEKSKVLDSQAEELGLGFKTFQNVIPKQFPIVPFALPEKLTSKLKSDETMEDNDKDNDETMEGRAADFAIEDNTGTPKSLENSAESSLERQSNWISTIVNQTREEFLENLPNLF